MPYFGGFGFWFVASEHENILPMHAKDASHAAGGGKHAKRILVELP